MINTSCKLISGLALGLAAPVWAQGWQLTVTEKGVVDGVHVMAIEAPFTYDFHTYQFVLQRDCPRGEPECATLYVLPDAPLPVAEKSPAHSPAAAAILPEFRLTKRFRLMRFLAVRIKASSAARCAESSAACIPAFCASGCCAGTSSACIPVKSGNDSSQ